MHDAISVEDLHRAAAVLVNEGFVTDGQSAASNKGMPNVRIVPLPDFTPVIVGVLWRGKTSSLLQAFLDELQLRAKRFLQSTAKESAKGT